MDLPLLLSFVLLLAGSATPQDRCPPGSRPRTNAWEAVLVGRSAEAPGELDSAVGNGWVARPEDNLVGLRDPAQLSNPARVDFTRLFEATAEMQQLRRDRIDPDSPQGIQLKTRARNRVAGACGRVMEQRGYCSIWKAISHSDGRSVPDVTEDARLLL
jgi:hypothetical protein